MLATKWSLGIRAQLNSLDSGVLSSLSIGILPIRQPETWSNTLEGSEQQLYKGNWKGTSGRLFIISWSPNTSVPIKERKETLS